MWTLIIFSTAHPPPQTDQKHRIGSVESPAQDCTHRARNNAAASIDTRATSKSSSAGMGAGLPPGHGGDEGRGAGILPLVLAPQVHAPEAGPAEGAQPRAAFRLGRR